MNNNRNVISWNQFFYQKLINERELHVFSIGMFCAQSFNSLSLLMLGLLIFRLMTLKTCTVCNNWPCAQNEIQSVRFGSVSVCVHTNNGTISNDHHADERMKSRMERGTKKNQGSTGSRQEKLCECVCVCERTSTIFTSQSPRAFHSFSMIFSLVARFICCCIV